jgi:hypothetical protein
VLLNLNLTADWFVLQTDLRKQTSLKEEGTVKNFSHQRLETLHQEAKQYRQFENLSQRDRSTFIEAFTEMFKIAKHWTIGITPIKHNTQRKTI